LDNYCDTVDVYWGVCTNGLCFSGFGAFASFPIVQTTDTLKVCYNAYIMNIPDPTISCSEQCEWLVYNGTEWVEMGSVVSINEVLPRPFDNKSYDLMGRELKYIPAGTVYIRNGRLYK